MQRVEMKREVVTQLTDLCTLYTIWVHLYKKNLYFHKWIYQRYQVQGSNSWSNSLVCCKVVSWRQKFTKLSDLRTLWFILNVKIAVPLFKIWIYFDQMQKFLFNIYYHPVWVFGFHIQHLNQKRSTPYPSSQITVLSGKGPRISDPSFHLEDHWSNSPKPSLHIKDPWSKPPYQGLHQTKLPVLGSPAEDLNLRCPPCWALGSHGTLCSSGGFNQNRVALQFLFLLIFLCKQVKREKEKSQKSNEWIKSINRFVCDTVLKSTKSKIGSKSTDSDIAHLLQAK